MPNLTTTTLHGALVENILNTSAPRAHNKRDKKGKLPVYDARWIAVCCRASRFIGHQHVLLFPKIKNTLPYFKGSSWMASTITWEDTEEKHLLE
jgi:hypothetical protein